MLLPEDQLLAPEKLNPAADLQARARHSNSDIFWNWEERDGPRSMKIFDEMYFLKKQFQAA